jgi:hypothetical protein
MVLGEIIPSSGYPQPLPVISRTSGQTGSIVSDEHAKSQLYQPMIGLRHFQTLIATEDRLYVAADGSIYAFGF